MILYRTAGSRPKSKLSRNKRRKKPCNQVIQSNLDNENTTLHRKKIKHAQAQKKYFSTPKGKASLAVSQKAYFNNDKGRTAQKAYFNSDKGRTAQKAYFNSGKGKNKLAFVQKSYYRTAKGRLKLKAAQKTYFSTGKGKHAVYGAHKAYASTIKGIKAKYRYRTSTKAKMPMHTAQKSYFRTAKAMHNNNKTNKQYYDNIHDQDSLARNNAKKLVYLKGVLNKVVDKGNSQLATELVTETCFEKNKNDEYNCDLSDILKSIKYHKPSPAVWNRYNEDVKKKLGSNCRTVNPPLKKSPE